MCQKNPHVEIYDAGVYWLWGHGRIKLQRGWVVLRLFWAERLTALSCACVRTLVLTYFFFLSKIEFAIREIAF